jgi:beta-lactamase class C
MAIFAQLALDQLADKTLWQPAMLETQKPLFVASPSLTIGMAWQFTTEDGVHIVDKDGALPFTSTYVGVVPAKQLAVVILVNSGNAPVTGVGRKILERLAGLASPD